MLGLQKAEVRSQKTEGDKVKNLQKFEKCAILK